MGVGWIEAYMVGVLREECVDHKRMQGTAEKARDGAPKAG
jgi:hypothetical protein